MGLGTQTLCMRDVVNDRSGWKDSDKSDGWIHSHSIWPLSFAPLGLQPTNAQILAKKDADGKEKVSKCQRVRTNGIPALIKTDTETAAASPPAINTTTQQGSVSYRRMNRPFVIARPSQGGKLAKNGSQ